MRSAALVAGLVLLAAAAASAQTCTTEVPADAQNFAVSYLSGPTDASSGKKAATTWCFSVTNNAQRGAAAKSCDPSTCCATDGGSLLSAIIKLPSSCTSGKGAAAARAGTWTLNGKDGIVKDAVVGADGELKLTFKNGFADPTGKLCGTFPGPPTADCSLGQICSAGCSFRFVTSVSSLTSKAKATCCTKRTVVPTACPSGQGSPDGYSCAACAAGQVAQKAPAGGLPKCKSCPAGSIPNAAGADCVASCGPGTGGAACAACAPGTYSPGGTAANPFAECTPCPAGTTSLSAFPASAADCNVAMCAAGTGGLGCGPCTYGTYSEGGTPTQPFRTCQRCPSGTYTTTMSSRSRMDCSSPAGGNCAAGYTWSDGACHRCPPNTWSPGGSQVFCNLCPDGTGTNGNSGAKSQAECTVTPGKFNGGGIWSWSNDGDGLFGQQCRSDLASLFSGATFDTRTAAIVRYDPASCSASEEGSYEMKAIWYSGILSKITDSVFKPTTAGSIALDFLSAGAGDYTGLWGAGPKAKIPVWTDISTLDASWSAWAKVGFSTGPVVSALCAPTASASDRDSALSNVNEAIRTRLSIGFIQWQNQLTQDATYMYFALRATKEALELCTPGLRPEGAYKPTTMVPLNAPAGSAGLPSSTTGKTTSTVPLTGWGMYEVPVDGETGNYRNLVCGTGVYFGTSNDRASEMAIDGWDYAAYCKVWPGTSGTEVTEVRFSKVSNDADTSQDIQASLEIQLTLGGVAVSGSAKVGLSKSSNKKGVTISTTATRVLNPPLALPEQAPSLTTSAKRVLRDQGEYAFERIYGTHFIVGWRQYGSLRFDWFFQSDETTSQMDIEGNVSIELMGKAGAKASASFKNNEKFSNVNVQNSIWSNTHMPTNCAKLAIGTDEPSNDDMKTCIQEWFDADGSNAAARSAYAVPFIYHPDYQAIQDERNGSSTPLGRRRLLTDDDLYRIAGPRMRKLMQNDAGPDINYRFLNTGLLRTRARALQSSIDQYKFKDDAFYYNVQSTLEKASNTIDMIFAALQNETITDIGGWQPWYKVAVGLLDKASEDSRISPLGAKCGWCVQISADKREGRCSVACTSTRDCSVTCPTPYKVNSVGVSQPFTPALGPYPNLGALTWVNETKDCGYSGYTYQSKVTPDGVSVPTCKVAITGPACAVFGNEKTDLTGTYYCKKTVCDWQNEYCDGSVERDPAGVWACLGNCTARPTTAAAAGSCYCASSGNITASSIYPPDVTNDRYCFFGEKADPFMFTGGNGISGPTSWPSRDFFEETFGGLRMSLYSLSDYYPNTADAYNGYPEAKSGFLVTKCPTYPLTVQFGDRRNAYINTYGTWNITGLDKGYDTYTLNSCVCDRATNTWRTNLITY